MEKLPSLLCFAAFAFFVEIAVAQTEGEPSTSQGPDLIVGGLGEYDGFDLRQFGRLGPVNSGTVGLAIGTTACNKGDAPVNWIELPNVDHPMFPLNLYRLKSVNGSDRFEQIGQSWLKHGFGAGNYDECNLGCEWEPDTHYTELGVGCSDPYVAGQIAIRCALAPRSVLNPYTGVIPGGDKLPPGGGCLANFPSRNHIGHIHTPISHRLQVQDVDLIPSQNPGALYFIEAQYIAPHEFAAGNGNQNNNVSHRRTSVSGPDGLGVFFFASGGPTMSEQPAVNAWPGSQQSLIEPAPLVDGRAFLACKATDLGAGQWHYEYAIYNMNLDRAIGSFHLPLPSGVTITNAGFHAPLNHAPELNADNYSNAPWHPILAQDFITWSTESFATNPLANALRWGTLYNFRFDADAPPAPVEASVGFFKTGGFMNVETLGPTPLVAPQIVHANGLPGETRPHSGYIDPRAESTDGAQLNLGLTSFTLLFSQPVFGAQGEAVSPADFTVTQTGKGGPPMIAVVDASQNPRISLTLSRPITLREWTTIQANVQNAAALPIAKQGDLGPGQNETDRVDVGFLPADVNQSGQVSPLDLVRFKQYVNGLATPAAGDLSDFVDINRSGAVNPLDLLRFKQQINGISPATQTWAGATMNHEQP